MNRILLASAVALLSGTAFAADMGTRVARTAIPAPAPYRSWTGCYVGAHVGAGWSRTTFTDANGTVIPAGSDIRANGGANVVGGAQIGCDYEFAKNWVIGAAGDFTWANIEGQASDPFFANKSGPITLQSRTKSLASVTGRLGYAFDTFLLYGKGGVAWSRSQYDVNNWSCALFTTCSPTGSSTRTGWTAGIGAEWPIAPSWTLMIEYDHYAFGTKALTLVDASNPAFPLTMNVKQDNDVVKVGLNYRFGSLLR